MVGAGSQGKAPHWVVVGGEKWSELPQIGRWWVQGRLVVGMDHISECGAVVASVGAPPWPMLSGGSQAMGDTKITPLRAP